LILLLRAVAAGLRLRFALRGVILFLLLSMQLAGMAGIFLAIPTVAVLSVMHRHLLEYRGSGGGLVSELLKRTQSVPDAAHTTSDPPATPATYPATDTAALESRRTAVTQ
jgi:hypothetical protein